MRNATQIISRKHLTFNQHQISKNSAEQQKKPNKVQLSTLSDYTKRV